MNERTIIVISGKQFSGKDTVANILLELLPAFKRAALADAIKIEFGRKKKLTFDEIDRNKPLYRSELIKLGNKGRAEDPNFWIKKVLEEKGNIIVSDVRLQHELEIFRNHGAITIRVNADRDVRAQRGTLVREDDPTEIDLDNVKNWDYVIENNDGYKDLRKKTEKAVKQIEKKLLVKAK